MSPSNRVVRRASRPLSHGLRVLLCLSAGVLLASDAYRLAARVQAPAPQAAVIQQPAEPPPGRFGNDSTLSPLERRGRDTWYFWTAGGQAFWRKVAVLTDGITDLLQFIDSRLRDRRFRTMGVINDPDCRKATQPDEYGLWLDACSADPVSDIPGAPSGIVGLRRFANPRFDPSKWSVERYLQSPRNAEPPYLVGMACGFCHVGFDPLNPPADPERPAWGNLAPAIGNQYFEEGTLFGLKMTPADFRWHVANRQPPGTSDTSRFATDHINNANAINSIFYLAERPSHQERMSDGTLRPVHHILKDGADSIGTAGASLRVYVNIGMCSDYWVTLHDPVYGMADQRPFSIDKARRECPDWRETEARMPAAEAFLKTIGPMRLKDAPGGPQYQAADPAVPQRGKLVFADRCATCHSSKQPPQAVASDAAQAKQWMRDAVLADDFLERNYLSDDRRHPVTRIGTNIARAVASNAVQGHVWQEFSSTTYKELPSVGTLRNLYNPLDPGSPLDFAVPGGGRGYYRTPTLVSVWATAPYLHNNSVGLYTKDPSVQGRLIAFRDGMEKLLWPERRLGVQSIPTTTEDSRIRLSTGPIMEVPAGTPINVIARVDPTALPALGQRSIDFLHWAFGSKFLLGRLLAKNLAPDFIEDRGHTFGSDLSDEDKLALIEFVKTF
jgi:hypothetical protein